MSLGSSIVDTTVVCMPEACHLLQGLPAHSTQVLGSQLPASECNERGSVTTCLMGDAFVRRVLPSDCKIEEGLTQQRLLSLDVTKVEVPGEADTVDLTLVSQSVHLRAWPALCKSMMRLAAPVMVAVQACSAPGKRALAIRFCAGPVHTCCKLVAVSYGLKTWVLLMLLRPQQIHI